MDKTSPGQGPVEEDDYSGGFDASDLEYYREGGKVPDKSDALTKRQGETLEPCNPALPVLAPPMNMKELAEHEMSQLIPLAGTVELTTQQREILYAKVKDEDVEIRPDGLIYLPWMEYVSRLHDAFGMEWAIIPRGMPEMNPARSGILWGFFLMVKGKPAGFAIGEQEYYPQNSSMTWGDACEGAKSNALMRLCKGIGISLELWRPSFIKGWLKMYAESYPHPRGEKDKWGNVKKLWRKKAIPSGEGARSADKGPSGDEAANVCPPASGTPPPPISKPKSVIENGRYSDDAYPIDLDLRLPDGTTVSVSKFKALELFEKMKKAIGEERYYEVLSSCKYNKVTEIPVEEMHLVYSLLVGEWNKTKGKRK